MAASVGSETGYHYIIMEYVEGITLKDYISKKHRLNYKETLSIAIQVSRGIEAAHEKGIIHRDIKPQNIIISMDGKVKVTDFGIARAASENTIHSDVMGSVHYTSPEQARNGYVTEKSDIYSLGIVMYEMTTGHVPFDGESTVQIAIQHLQDEIVAPSAYAPDIPISLEKIILKCTQKSQDRRYDSMENLLIDLRKALISPNEDFVTDIPVTSKTRVISDSELNDIQERAYESDRIEDAIFDDEEDDEGEGRFLNPRMERIVTIAGIIAAIIIVLIVVLLLGNVMGLFHLGSGKNNDSGAAVVSVVSEESKESTTMIDLRGMTVSKAESELNKIGLSLNQSGTQASSEYEEGQIISQDIKEGETVRIGDLEFDYIE